MSRVALITDYAWPDTHIERRILEAAGLRVVCGSSSPASAQAIEALVREHQPSAVLTCWASVSGAAVRGSSALKIVARLGVGLDNIDVPACTERGIWVTNVPDYCVQEVSDHAIAFVLAWTRGLIELNESVHAGNWDPSKVRLRRLSELTCGIVGYGRIGRETARKLAAFNCRLLVNNLRPDRVDGFARSAGLDLLLQESDAVILHVPLTDATRHLMNRARLARMKPGSLLVNVSRGGIVDTDALIEALGSGHLVAAGLDVLEAEPDVPSELARRRSAVMMTPHVAFNSDASIRELRTRAAQEVARVLRGEAPLHPCNQPLIGGTEAHTH